MSSKSNCANNPFGGVIYNIVKTDLNSFTQEQRKSWISGKENICDYMDTNINCFSEIPFLNRKPCSPQGTEYFCRTCLFENPSVPSEIDFCIENEVLSKHPLKRRKYSYDLCADSIVKEFETNYSLQYKSEKGLCDHIRNKTENISVRNIEKQVSNGCTSNEEECDLFEFTESQRCKNDNTHITNNSNSGKNNEWSSRGNRSINHSMRLSVPKGEFYLSHASSTKIPKQKNISSSKCKTSGHRKKFRAPKKLHILCTEEFKNKKHYIENYFCKKKYIEPRQISTDKLIIPLQINSCSKPYKEPENPLDGSSIANQDQSKECHTDSRFNINIALQLSSKISNVKASGIRSEKKISENIPLKRYIHKRPFSEERKLSNEWISLNFFKKKSTDEKLHKNSYMSVKKIQNEGCMIDPNKNPTCDESSTSIEKESDSISQKSQSSQNPPKSDWICRGPKTNKSGSCELSVTGDLFIRNNISNRTSQTSSHISANSTQIHRGKFKKKKCPIIHDKKRQSTMYDYFSQKHENIMKQKNNWDENRICNDILNNEEQNRGIDNKQILSELHDETKSELKMNNIERIEGNMFGENIVETHFFENSKELEDIKQDGLIFKTDGFSRKIDEGKFEMNGYNSEAHYLIKQKINTRVGLNKKIPITNSNSSSQHVEIQKDLNNSECYNSSAVVSIETYSGKQSSLLLNESELEKSIAFSKSLVNEDARKLVSANVCKEGQNKSISFNIQNEMVNSSVNRHSGEITSSKSNLLDQSFFEVGHKALEGGSKSLVNGDVSESISSNVCTEGQNKNILVNILNEKVNNGISRHNGEITSSTSKPVASFLPQKSNILWEPSFKVNHKALEGVYLANEDGRKFISPNVYSKGQNDNISVKKQNKTFNNSIDRYTKEITSSKCTENVHDGKMKSSNSKPNMLLGSFSKGNYNALEVVSSPILTDPECQTYLKALVGENIEPEIKERVKSTHISENIPSLSDIHLIPDEEEFHTNQTNSEENNFLNFWENMLSQNQAEYSQTLTKYTNESASLTQTMTQNSHPEIEKRTQEGSEIFQYILSPHCTQSNSLINNAVKNMNNLSLKIMEKRSLILNSNNNANKLLRMALDIYAQYKERSILSNTQSSVTAISLKLGVVKKHEDSEWIYTIKKIFDVDGPRSDNCTTKNESLTLWTHDMDTRSASEADKKILIGLKEICLNKSYLYDETSDGPLMVVNSRLGIINKIETIFEKILNDFDSDKYPYLEIRRQTFEDCIFINGRLDIKLEENPKMIKVKYQNTSSQLKFCIMMYILAKVLQVIETNSKTTRRELYYQIKHLISNQSYVDRAVKAVSCMLCIGPWDLNIVAHKGMVFGDLKITMSSNEIIDCSLPGTLIPQDVDEISELRSSAHFILVVEKESIFYKILEEKLPSKLVRPFLMITGKGFPDLNTQLFLKKLWVVMSIPIFIFTDADPHGVNIMMTYRFGSLANAHLSQQLAIPKAQWLGVFPSEVVRLNADKQILTDIEKNVIKNLLKTPYMKINKKIEEELKFMLEFGYKAGIEAIIKNHTFLSEFYFPLKFHNKDLI